jgi:hypothetical protein
VKPFANQAALHVDEAGKNRINLAIGYVAF